MYGMFVSGTIIVVRVGMVEPLGSFGISGLYEIAYCVQL
jgi:hypothetical protein